MKKSKLNSEKILSLISEEATILLKKRETYNKIKDLLKEVETLNECRGMSSTFGFKSSGDVLNKAGVGGFGDAPTLVSRFADLQRDMEGFGDEFEPVEKEEENEAEILRAENEMLKKELEALKQSKEV